MTGKQRGNTLLGLVIGALIGLGIALAVAVYITKMPVPFTNKAVPSQSEVDEAETLKNKDWNPNASLGSRPAIRLAPSASGEIAPSANPASPAVEQPGEVIADPAQPAAKAVPALPLAPAKPMAADPLKPLERPAAVVPPATPAKSASADPLGDLARSVARPAAVALPATPAKSASADPLGDLAKSVSRPAAVALPAVPVAPRSADPLGDLAKAKTTAAVPLVSGQSDPFNYFVQAGAFRTAEDAEKQRIRLQALGLQPRVSEREQAGRTVFRVRVGPFDKKDEADQMTDRLNSQSIDTALVRVQR